MDILLRLIHIMVIGVLLLYIGVMGFATHPYVFILSFALGVFIILYHGYRAYQNKAAWINLAHIFIFAPLFLYVGWKKENTEKCFFQLLAILGFGVIGFHSYKLAISV
jgi:hypothetical protein